MVAALWPLRSASTTAAVGGPDQDSAVPSWRTCALRGAAPISERLPKFETTRKPRAHRNRIIVNANYHWTQSRNSFLLLFSAAARAVPPSLHRNFSPPRPPARALNLLLSLAWNEVHSKLHDYPSRQYPQSRRASRAKTWDHECAKTWTTRARRRIEISDGVRACWVMQMCLPANTARRRGRRSSHGAPLMTHGR